MLTVELLPILSDNYSYLLRCGQTGKTAIVDPGAEAPIAEHLQQRNLGLDMIMLTHHHSDHIAGSIGLKHQFGAVIVGPGSEAHRIASMDRMVAPGERIAVGVSEATVIATPGHTSGQIAYHFAADNALFSADALFALGCGRVFEGTMEQTWSTMRTLRDLPDDTLIYCGHEYTLSNARYAVHVDPKNTDLRVYVEELQALRDEGKPTIPAKLGRERRTNPFLRADNTDLAETLGMGGSDPVSIFTALRQGKDTF